MTSVDGNLIAAGLRELANFFDETMTGPTAAALAQAAQQPAKPRGRGRPPKAEAPAPAAPAPAPAAPEADPFAAPAPTTPAAPTATLEEVRAALTALKTATTQEIALGVLKSAGGADNLTSLAADKYGAVVNAAKLAVPLSGKPIPEIDPFAVPETAAPAKALTLEDVKAAIVAAQKRTGTDTVQKVVMAHGGQATNPDTGAPAPSLKALPPEKFAAVIAAIQALPTTK